MRAIDEVATNTDYSFRQGAELFLIVGLAVLYAAHFPKCARTCSSSRLARSAMSRTSAAFS